MDDHVGWIVVLGFRCGAGIWFAGIEHGHIYVLMFSLARMPWAAFCSLCLHALIESMPLHGDTHNHAHHNHHSHVHLHGIEGVDMALMMG